MGLVLPGFHHFDTGGTWPMPVLLFFTSAAEEMLLIWEEKCIELNNVRSDSDPGHTPLLHKPPPTPCLEERSRSPLLLGGEPEALVRTTLGMRIERVLLPVFTLPAHEQPPSSCVNCSKLK